MKKTFLRRLLPLTLILLLLTVAAMGTGLVLGVAAADPDYEASWGNSDTYGNNGSVADAFAYANSLSSGTARIKLAKDVATAQVLTLYQGKSLILDLNGKKLTRGLISATSDGYVLYVRGSLTLTDNSVGGGGEITGGYNSGPGGGIYVNDGTLNIKGGSVIGNKSSSNGGGIYSTAAGRVIVDGGKVTLNQSQSMGGGIYAAGACDIISGEVSSNQSSSQGGGLYVAGVCTLSGGSVQGNTAGAAPGGIYYDSLIVSGRPVITGNSLSGSSGGGAASNVLINNQITISSSGLNKTEARIGVSVGTPPTSSTPFYFTGYNNDDYSACFVSDNANYRMEAYRDGSNYRVAAALLPIIWGANASCGDGGGDIAALKSHISALTLPAAIYVKLQRNVTLDAPLEIPDGLTLRLDLDGCELKRSLYSPAPNGNVITVKGALILDDSIGQGKISGGKNTDNGGGILVASGGLLTVNRAIITSNSAKDGGGIYIDAGARETTLNGGTSLLSNSATRNGGGIYIASGSLTVGAAVSINNNTASSSGGGIYISSDASVNFSAGVSGNSAQISGGGIYNNGLLTVSGAAYVHGNTKGTAANNIYLTDDKIVTISIVVGLNGNARMGITTEKNPTASAPVTITSYVSSNHSGYFFSDNTSFGIQNNGSGSNQLLKLCNQSVSVGSPSGSLTRRVSVSGLTIPVTTSGVSNGIQAYVTWYNNAGKSASGDSYRPSGVTLTAGRVSDNKVTLTLSSSGSSNAGDFYFTVTIDNMESDISILTVGRTKLILPKPNGPYYYTGANQTLSLSGFDSTGMTIVGGNVQKNVGFDYRVVIAIRDKTQYEWSDGTTEDKSISWDIYKARVTKPSVNGLHYYKGANQTAQLNNFNSTLMSVSGNEKKAIGTYVMTISLKDNSSYEWAGDNSSADLTLTWEIKKAPLTIRANDLNIVYGDPFSAYTASYIGLAGGETSSVLSGTLTLSCSYKQYSNAGVYIITPAGLSSANYEITYVAGNLTVGKKPVTVLWENTSFTYDGRSHLPSGTLLNYSGAGKISVSGSRTDAGTHTAEAIGFNDINFKLANPTQSFTITPLPLTVKANDASIVYGSAPVGNGVIYNGFLAGENDAQLSGSLTYSFDYEKYGNVGSYKVIPAGLSSPNYAITYLPGKLTVAKAPLSVKLNDIFALDGDAELTYEVVAGEFFNGDERMLTILRSPGDTPGKYPIAGSVAGSNYDFTISGASYVILQREVKTTGETYGISMSAPGGINPDYKLSIRIVDARPLKKNIAEGSILAAYDVSLLNNMVSVQPGGSVTIKFPAADYAEYENIAVVHIDKAGSSKTLSTTREDGCLVVKVDSLSTFAIVSLSPANYAWVWILSISVIVLLGGGLCVYLFVLKKKL